MKTLLMILSISFFSGEKEEYHEKEKHNILKEKLVNEYIENNVQEWDIENLNILKVIDFEGNVLLMKQSEGLTTEDKIILRNSDFLMKRDNYDYYIRFNDEEK